MSIEIENIEAWCSRGHSLTVDTTQIDRREWIAHAHVLPISGSDAVNISKSGTKEGAIALAVKAYCRVNCRGSCRRADLYQQLASQIENLNI